MPAYKNRAIQASASWKNNVLFGLLLLMIASVLVSRAALSCTVILFLLLTIASKDFGAQWKRFLASRYALCFTLLFLIPFFSGLWSKDLGLWLDVLRLKLPLLFFPLAFAGSWRLTGPQQRVLMLAFLAVVFAGCAWSLLHYVLHTAEVNAAYLKAKTLQTPLGNDHVRFSWLVSVAVIACFFFRPFFLPPQQKVLLALAAFFVVYLHILSARTGLGALYLFLLLFAGRLLLNKRSRRVAVAVLALLVCLPLLAYLFVPTFQNRLRYLVYDFSFVQKAQYLPGANDGARVLSLKAGWQVLLQHPLGVGAGDVLHATNNWYAAHVPGMLPTDKLAPCSEWLLYGAMAGWPGMIVFTLVMLLPFFQPIKKQHRIYWRALHATAAFGFLFDMGLEVQYGIFLYAFVTFWWKRIMNDE